MARLSACADAKGEEGWSASGPQPHLTLSMRTTGGGLTAPRV